MKKKVMILCTGLFLLCGAWVIIRISGGNDAESVHRNEENNKENKDPNQVSAPAEPQVTFEDYSQKFADEDGRILLEVTEICPVIELSGQEELTEKMNRVFEQQHGANAAAIQNTWKAAWGAYQNLPKENRAAFSAYRMGFHYETVYLTRELLSIREECSRYTTGAEETDALAYTFAVSEGKLLTLSDIFADGKAARAVIQQKIQDTVTGEAYRGKLLEDYESYLYDILREDNFYLDGTGMVVICNPGIITTEDSGYIEVAIPYEELSGMLEDAYLPAGKRGDRDGT